MENHSERKHSLLSASGSARWLNCTPSPRLEEQFGTESSSVYAEEGTLAHEYAEISVRLGLKEISKRDYNKKLKAIQSDPLYDTEMDEEVEKYTNYVFEQYQESKRKNNIVLIHTEHKFDLSHYVPKAFGTNDNVIVGGELMEVIDLKYGKGVSVSAVNNTQLMLYGLGALLEVELITKVETVRMTIVQPRLDSISSWEISAEDLIQWGQEFVRPRAIAAWNGSGELVPGDHCRWCKIRPRCKALADQNMEIAKKEFAEPMLLSDGELIEVYEQSNEIINWLRVISSYILEEAKNGKEWPGYKLVEGRSNRKWADEEEAKNKLKEEGYTDEQILNMKLKGIGDIEKLVGKKVFPVLLETAVTKPPGNPTLVPESDKRPAMGNEQAKQEFKEE